MSAESRLATLDALAWAACAPFSPITLYFRTEIEIVAPIMIFSFIIDIFSSPTPSRHVGDRKISRLSRTAEISSSHRHFIIASNS